MEAVPIPISCCETAARSLADAFVNDPVCQYIFPETEVRLRTMQWIFCRWMRIIVHRKGAFATPGFEGAALWHPPEAGVAVGLWEQVRAGFLMSVFKLGLREQARGFRVHADVNDRLRRHIQEPHWVLDTLGVAPEHQGKGCARALLQPILARADAARTPCYVITHNPGNVPFYEGFGFELLEAGGIRGTSLNVFSLRRSPRTPMIPNVTA